MDQWLGNNSKEEAANDPGGTTPLKKSSSAEDFDDQNSEHRKTSFARVSNDRSTTDQRTDHLGND
jgi:hypothetical protein